MTSLSKAETKNVARIVKVWKKKNQEASLEALVVVTALLAENEKDVWYIDISYSRHMIGEVHCIPLNP